ncbi:TRAP transporter small permease subunit [Azoarcus sp. TTM-91]|uniref:TRAP transporter small permease n=1 Tax=Azoarcus sp. TTM-91 TaxID=2691581 RepID=UPI00145FAD56|nr:TRAP transporter small permease [Azoarcus sp. TTM-91]NMG33381.1 TRAP transporter small permease subunit [Azoarcus sp. TTM-91]
MLKVLDHLEEWLIAFLMGAATVIIFVSVLHRYGTGIDYPALQDVLLSINLGWAQELTIIMFVWMAKFGAAYGVRTGIHVGVDVLINRLSTENRGRFILLGLGAGALFTAIVGTLGATFVWENGAHYQIYHWFGITQDGLYEGPVTPDLEWPTWMVYAAVPLGSYLMCFRFLQVMWSFWKTGELPHHDHGHVDGIDEEHLPADANPYDMGDNLHPHDLKHKQIGEDKDAGKGDKQ